ncbi:MAG TPA: SRPBCC family protein [Acidimicrobiales bacterium]|nr:SRPBCC family protein [Acidimicrobiales bacterium]
MELTNDFRVGVPVETAWEVLTDVERIAPCMPGAQLQEVEGDEYRGVVKVKVGPVTAQYKGAARFVERDEAGRKLVLRAEGRETRGQGNANATITAQLTPDGDGTAVSVVTDLTVTGRVAQFGRGVMADVSSKLLGQFVDCLENKLLASPDAAAGGGASESAGSSGSSGGNAAQPVVPAATAGVDTGGEGHGPLDVASEGARAADAVERAGREAAASRSAGSAGSPAATSGPAVRVVDSPEVEPVDLLDAAGAPVAKRAVPVVAGLTFLWLLSIFLRRRRRKP